MNILNYFNLFMNNKKFLFKIIVKEVTRGLFQPSGTVIIY